MSYARRKVLKALLSRGVTVVREGAVHTILRGPGGSSTLPRHNQLDRVTTRTIAKQLGLDWSSVERDLS